LPNPFDLRGQEFLIFYIILGTVVNLLLRYLILWKERQEAPTHWDATDPYKIAYLRAGINEALRTALFSLIDRGLLKAADVKIQAESKAKDLAKRDIEKAIVKFFEKPKEVQYLFSDTTASGVGEVYKQQLSSEGLIANSKVLNSRKPMVFTALLFLIGISAAKIVIAIMRARYNILFLIILTFFFGIWSIATWQIQKTGSSDEVLSQLKSRFNMAKKNAARLRPGGMTSDAAFLVAIFGLTVLPKDYFPYVKRLFPQAYSTIGGTSYGGGCGTAGCGSSGCSGGGCGGGGCGGCGGG